jgi:hypothetical protein
LLTLRIFTTAGARPSPADGRLSYFPCKYESGESRSLSQPLRKAGWPQATTVGYVNDGLTIYFLCSPQSQKAANLARDNRVSLTIDHDVNDPMAITGLSMAAQAQPVTDPGEVAKAMNLLGTRHPEYMSLPMPRPEEIAVYRVLPKMISILDYSKGFGHSDLVTV